MDALGACGFRHSKQLVDREIALHRRRWPYGVRLVAQPHMQSVRVSLGIDRDGA
jgi:hypothetical protein